MRNIIIAASIAIALAASLPAEAGTVLDFKNSNISMAPFAHEKNQRIGILYGDVCRYGAYYCVGVGAGPVGYGCCGCGLCGAWSTW